MEKRIEVIEMRAGDIKTGFGNPRKITQKKKQELERSLEMLGDFGVFVIDQDNNIIAGNQRLEIIKGKDPDTMLCCKKLFGYTEGELKAINIKDNTHAGEWDIDLLADWTSDLVVDLDIKEEIKEGVEERSIPELELIHYEKYDYVMIACRSQLDYNDLVRKLGIENRKVVIAKSRKIKARAIWYEAVKANILSDEELKQLEFKFKNKAQEEAKNE